MRKVVSKQESQIRLSARGQWFHEGKSFENTNVIEFFHKAIRKDEEGEFYLYNRLGDLEEHVYFEVGDTAYFVQDLVFVPESRCFRILLNTQDIQVLDLGTLVENQRGVMYCRLSEGDRARFSQSALTKLADFAQSDDRGIYVDATGEKIYISNHS